MRANTLIRGESMATDETVARIEDFKGHKMIEVGKTRISLAKAMKMVNNAEAIKTAYLQAVAEDAVKKAEAETPESPNPFM